MPGHDVIVIGGSAGSLTALITLVGALPADLPAALCITRHTSPQARNVLPYLLEKAGPLRATEAVDGEPLRAGHIYVAPPDYHLLVTPGHLRVTRSPTENRFRPAIDPLFRSAAVAYGPRVVGVILSGALDDGTAGLWAIKARGGVAVVQDPQEAQHSSMPQSAQTYVPVDYCLPAAAMAPLLVSLAYETTAEAEASPVPEELATETHIALGHNALPSGLLRLGQLSPYTCPTCHGVLLQLKSGRFLRFRCHTGHAFSAKSFLADLTESLDDSLWNILRGLDESVILMQHMAEHLQQEGHDVHTADLFARHAEETRRRSDLVRQMVMQPPVVPPVPLQEEASSADDEQAAS